MGKRILKKQFVQPSHDDDLSVGEKSHAVATLLSEVSNTYIPFVEREIFY